MPAHPDFVASFGTALRGGDLPAGLVARHPDEVGRRFAVYRNNVAVSLSAALASRFPVIRQLVGEAFFAALARLHAEQDRPKSPVLAEWGAGFAAFLEGFPPLEAYPYLGDVARIEYARGRAFHAADVRPVDPRALRSADPERTRLVLHPSVTLMELAHPAVSIWARHQPGGAGLRIPAGPETALILRDAAFAVPVRPVSRAETVFLRAVLKGERLSQAVAAAQMVEEGYDPQPVLVSLMQAGAIVDATE